jgi:hypothetical protein
MRVVEEIGQWNREIEGEGEAVEEEQEES